MILAWRCDRRTRQATRPNSFSRRKPVVVPQRLRRRPPSQGERGRVAFGAAQPRNMDGAGRGRFAQPGAARTERRERKTQCARVACSEIRLTR